MKIWYFDLVPTRSQSRLSYAHFFLSATLTKFHPCKVLVMSDVWWKFQLNWNRKTEDTYLQSFTFFPNWPPFYRTCVNKRKTIDHKDLKVYKSITRAQKRFQTNIQIRKKGQKLGLNSSFRVVFDSFYQVDCPKKLG